ncbi:MAG: DUF6155 family protein [Bacteroidia bacterium]
MHKLTKKALLKHLNKSDKEDIIREVISLFDKFKNVKEFYAAELSDEANPMLEAYKKKITKAYSSANPKERRTNMNVNRLISEFKKISIYERELADLMLYRVECGVAAFRRNNKRSATFYNCIIASFEDAVKLITANNYMNELRKRIDKIIKDSEAGKYGITERMEEILASNSL